MAGPAVTAKESGRDTHPRVVAQLRTPSYMTAALFIIISALDIATLALPANPGAVAWRFGTVGAASNYMLTLYFGVVLLCCTAAWFEDRTTLRVAAVAATLLAVILLLLLTDFALSALQLRGSVPDVEVAAYRIGTIKASAKYGLLAVALIAAGVFSWRAARRIPRTTR